MVTLWKSPHCVWISKFSLGKTGSPRCLLKIGYYLCVIMWTFSCLKIQFVDILNFFSCLVSNKSHINLRLRLPHKCSCIVREASKDQAFTEDKNSSGDKVSHKIYFDQMMRLPQAVKLLCVCRMTAKINV